MERFFNYNYFDKKNMDNKNICLLLLVILLAFTVADAQNCKVCKSCNKCGEEILADSFID